MLIITAPAKTFDFTSPTTQIKPTLPLFLNQAAEINQSLQQYSIKELQKLMHVSQPIAEENHKRFGQWNKKHTQQNARPALFFYKGDIYKEMHPEKYSHQQLNYAQKSLRIMSGFYGTVRPFDLIQAYRLEMKTKLKVQKSKDLYDFWKYIITREFIQEITEAKHRYLLNLASEEYSSVIDLPKLPCTVIKVEFGEKRGDKIENVAIYSKKARGMMIEYCIINTVEDPKDLRGFHTKGYRFLGEKNNTITFIR